MSGRDPRELKKNLALLSIASTFAFFAVEAAVRIMFDQPGFVPAGAPAGLLVPHPQRGYGYAPHFRGTISTSDYTIELAINEIGLRDRPIAGQGVDILAVGNSFTVGFGVEADEAWPAQLQDYLNGSSSPSHELRVLNGGVSGYSLAQIRLLLEEQLVALEPRLVILGLYAAAYWRLDNPYVFFEDAAVSRDSVPQLKRVDDGFIRSPFVTEHARDLYHWMATNIHVGAYAMEAALRLQSRLTAKASTPLPHEGAADSRHRLGALLLELEKTAKLAGDARVPLVVLLVAAQSPDGGFTPLDKEYNAIIRDFCARKGIVVFDPTPLLESHASARPIFRIGNDHHWSKDAHALVAASLGRFLREHGVLPR